MVESSFCLVKNIYPCIISWSLEVFSKTFLIKLRGFSLIDSQFISVDDTGAAESHQTAPQEKSDGDTQDLGRARLRCQRQLLGLGSRG